MHSINNPIFDFIEERPYDDILRDMGFEFEVIVISEDNEEHATYVADEAAFLRNWRPEVSEGFTLVWTYPTEDDEAVAVAVKPVTNFAKALFAFGDTPEARAAQQQDRDEARRKVSEQMNGRRAERGLPPLPDSYFIRISREAGE